MPNKSTNLVYTLAKHPMCALKAKPSASFPTHLPHLVLCCSAVYIDATIPSSIPSYHFLISYSFSVDRNPSKQRSLERPKSVNRMCPSWERPARKIGRCGKPMETKGPTRGPTSNDLEPSVRVDERELPSMFWGVSCCKDVIRPICVCEIHGDHDVSTCYAWLSKPSL